MPNQVQTCGSVVANAIALSVDFTTEWNPWPSCQQTEVNSLNVE